MAAAEPQPDPAPPASAVREVGGFLAELVAVGLLAAVCVAAPIAAAALVSPWLGVAVGVGGLWVWGRVGPRPYPGFLPGCLCLWGFAAILGSLLACLALGVREQVG